MSPAHRPTLPGDFDVVGLWEVVDAQREARSMTWNGVAKALGWMSADTMARMHERGTSTCNHVLPMIQWVGRTPESFTVDPDGDGVVHELLPDPAVGGGRWRWWWHHRQLAAALEVARSERGLSWEDVSASTLVPVAALKGLGKLRYGPTIGVAMMCSRWLERSAASFLTETPPQLTG